MENGKLTPAGFSWNQVKVHLRHASIDFRPVRTELNLEAPLSENGELRLKRVVPGDYRLSLINLPAGFYLKEARIGESDALKNLIHLGFAETKTLEIVIGATTSRVEGVAVDGQELAVSGAQVVLIPDHRQRTDLFKAATTTSNGRFTFTSVPPGDYKLFGWEMLEPYAYFDPELLRQVEARGVPVRVGEASSHTLRVTLIPEKE
jgi:hypothetical protein